VRVDELTKRLDTLRTGPLLPAVAPQPAHFMYLRRVPPVRGADVSATYGYLLHWTDAATLPLIWASGTLGASAGLWLTPSQYSACLTPYDLGLNSPRDVALVIDPRLIPALWGPGTSGPSTVAPNVWPGGAIEFFIPTSLGLEAIVDIIEAEPCGDLHR
jgi:hypothetical protein